MTWLIVLSGNELLVVIEAKKISQKVVVVAVDEFCLNDF